MATKILPVWASSGTKTKPNDTKIEQGWTSGEQPPHEWENERMSTRDTTINDMIDEIDAFTNNASSSDGASEIGVYEISDSPESISTGNLRGALTTLLDGTNARSRIASSEEITGRWGFTGVPSLMTPQLSLKDGNHTGKLACINNYTTDSNSRGIVHLASDQCLGYVGTAHTDPCAIEDPNIPGNYLLVLVESDGTNIHTVEPNTPSDTNTVAISGLNSGVTELTSACSDGENVYVLVKRSPGTDTIASIDPITGVVNWEVTATATSAFRGFPYDRIIAGKVISSSPWEVELYILSGNLEMQTSGVLEKRSSVDGSAIWSVPSLSQTTKKPMGGLAHDGTSVAVTTDITGSTIAKLLFFNASTGTETLATDMAGSGPLLSDAAYDIVYDGRKFAWISIGGHYRYKINEYADHWDSETEVGTSVALGYGFSIGFDGVNIWIPSFNDAQYKLYFNRNHAARAYDDYVEYPFVINTTDSWSPQSSPWAMGRGCRVGHHMVFSVAQPGSTGTRNAFIVIQNSCLWT